MAIVLGIAGSAFMNIEPTTEKTDMHWYVFEGNTSNLSEIRDHEKYKYVPTQPCEGTTTICGVEAPGPSSLGSNPDPFSNDLVNRLTNVFNQPSVYSYLDIAQKE